MLSVDYIKQTGSCFKLSCCFTAIGCLPACMQKLAAARITEPSHVKQIDNDRQPINLSLPYSPFP